MNFRLALLASGVFASLLVHAAEPVPKADSAKGQIVAGQVCVACHAADGNSPAAINPKLAGQTADYIAKQLKDFKSGARKNAIMQGIVAGLSEEQMRDVATFYATQRVQTGAASKDTLALGQKIYRAGVAEKGIAACAGCHGAKGEGVPSQYPRLGGQHTEYTEAQLKAWRSGERANDANKMMRAVAAKMSDAEIKAVSDYISGLH